MKTKRSFLLAILMISGFFFTQTDLAAQEENKKADSTDVIEKPVRYVEEMPEFIGGNDALYAFLRSHLKYPHLARENGIQGTVVIEFVVEKDGTISNVNAINSVSPETDEEAIRVIKMMPKWKPGKQSGKPVRVFYQLPFIFNLN